LTQPSCHNRLKSLNSFSVSLLAFGLGAFGWWVSKFCFEPWREIYDLSAVMFRNV
jgi:hypothetical protein